MRKTVFKRLLEINQIKRYCPEKIVVILLTIIVMWLLRYAHYGQETLFFAAPYESRVWYAFLPRISLYIIATVMILFLVFYTPSDRVPLLTTLGSNTMAIYLFHAFLRIYLLENIGLNTWMEIIFFTVVSCSVGYITNLKTMVMKLRIQLSSYRSKHS